MELTIKSLIKILPPAHSGSQHVLLSQNEFRIYPLLATLLAEYPAVDLRSLYITTERIKRREVELDCMFRKNEGLR